MSAPPVLVRCDGGAALGMGHVSRCLALAGEWRDAHRGAVTFAMRDPSGAAEVCPAGAAACSGAYVTPDQVTMAISARQTVEAVHRRNLDMRTS